ncbi:hypothetical protein CMV_004488 [Castanea mollissima]|uniref:Uncharacterized protein n=1 Tax=Castanea mollissima TaxID=60419 RepID=A0A8J4RRG0_9ROSI|nr:hypothetical protein CMV_004488 [Castanea mollissima]
MICGRMQPGHIHCNIIIWGGLEIKCAPMGCSIQLGNCGFYILWSLLVLPCYNQSNILSKTEAVYINGGKNEEKHYHAPIFSMLVKLGGFHCMAEKEDETLET